MRILLYKIKKVHHFFSTLLLGALPANIRYGFPSRKLKVIAITGTDGKTTTSTLLYKTLLTGQKKVGLISTVAAYIGNKEIDTGFHVTTPGPWQIQKLLAQFVKEKYEYVVLETTSHGIYQYRTWGIQPTIAGLTNITHNEALDYHVTYQEYVAAKCSKLRQAKSIWINGLDDSFTVVKKLLPAKKLHVYTDLSTVIQPVARAIRARFSEPYNHSNALLVYQIAKELGIQDDVFIAALTQFSGIPGRMQEVPNKLGLTIIVDFAHTPNGLKQALLALKQRVPDGKKLIAVFGCAGLRDPGKRAPMGKWATELADYAVFTAEDPRTEDIWSIIRQMKEQLTSHHDKIISIPDREQAIEFSITHLAKKGDIIAVFGKGHEQSMSYGTVEYPWNDTRYIHSLVS